MQHLCGQASFKILHSAGLLHLNHRTGIVWHCGMHCNWTTYVPNCEFMCCGKFWIHTVTNQHLINSATCSFNGKWISNWDNNLSNCDVLRCAGYAEVSRVLANNWLALPTFKVCVSQTENYAVLQEHKINARWAKRVQEKKKMQICHFSLLVLSWNWACWEVYISENWKLFFFLFIVLHAWKLTFYQTALMHNVENNNNCEANPFALLAVVKCRSCWHVGWHFVAA